MALRELLKRDLGTVLRGAPAQAGRSHVWPGPVYLRLQRWRRDLLMVTEQLAALVKANAPMVRGLDAAAMDAPNGNVEAILLTMRDDLAAGESLADAMALRPRFFPAHYVDLVRAGERTGHLRASLQQASDSVTRLIDLRVRKNQFWYPAILLFVHIQLGIFMLVKIYPVFEEIHAEFDSQTAISPWLVAAIDFLRMRGSALLVLALISIAAVFVGSRFLWRWRDGVALYIPGWRRIARKRRLAHIAQVLKTLLRADVPLDRAVAECAVLSGPRPYRRALADVEERVEAGQSLADALGHYPRLFHQPFRDMVRLGETSERLPEILDRLVALYDAQTSKADRIAVDVSVAVMVVLVGVLTFGATLIIFESNVALVSGILGEL
jgi:type IV pilus assembly protein PilC